MSKPNFKFPDISSVAELPSAKVYVLVTNDPSESFIGVKGSIDEILERLKGFKRVEKENFYYHVYVDIGDGETWAYTIIEQKVFIDKWITD